VWMAAVVANHSQQLEVLATSEDAIWSPLGNAGDAGMLGGAEPGV